MEELLLAVSYIKKFPNPRMSLYHKLQKAFMVYCDCFDPQMFYTIIMLHDTGGVKDDDNCYCVILMRVAYGISFAYIYDFVNGFSYSYRYNLTSYNPIK